MDVAEEERHAIVRGATEADLVACGLEETMTRAVRETLDSARKLRCTLRAATYCNSIRRILRDERARDRAGSDVEERATRRRARRGSGRAGGVGDVPLLEEEEEEDDFWLGF